MQISQESLISGDFYLCEPNEEIIDLNYKCDNFDCNLMMNTLKLFSKMKMNLILFKHLTKKL